MRQNSFFNDWLVFITKLVNQFSSILHKFIITDNCLCERMLFALFGIFNFFFLSFWDDNAGNCLLAINFLKPTRKYLELFASRQRICLNQNFTSEEIVSELDQVNFHTGLFTATIFWICYSLKPMKRRIVDRLCNIKSKVKSSVVCSSKDQNELIGSVLHLWYLELGTLFFQNLRIYQCCLMPHKLLAFSIQIWKMLFGNRF